jgi:GTP:adenosylcobinamide-phosphate guanylyltransferase
MTATAVLLAAGQGTRARASGLSGPKFLLRLDNEPLIVRLLKQLDLSKVFSSAIVTIRPEHREFSEHAAAAAVSLPTSFIEIANESSIETLRTVLPRVKTRIVVVIAADLVVETTDVVDFLRSAVSAMESESTLGSVQPIGAVLQPTRGKLMVGPESIISVSGEAAQSEGPRVFTADLLETVLHSTITYEWSGVLHFVEYLVQAGWRMRGMPLHRVMDVDERKDLVFAESLIENGLLDRMGWPSDRPTRAIAQRYAREL